MDYRDFAFKDSYEKLISHLPVSNHILNSNEDLTFDRVEIKGNRIVYYQKNEPVLDINLIDRLIISQIGASYSSYIRSFKKEIKDKGIYSDSSIVNFCDDRLDALKQAEEQILNANHLPKEVKDAWSVCFRQCYEYISRYLQDKTKPKSKIRIRLSKNEFVSLVHLFMENNIIDTRGKGLKISEIYFILEQSFEIVNSKAEVKSLKKLRKLELELFGPQADRSPDKALKKLRALLDPKTFYKTS